ncbi:hypothetical protein ColLi_02790 [Colletotrichum liriopes]|uniref:Uncharacterized protein n=1 Tax=Colletotrichum liriopes TaxID=708192 RepID=A0AA37GG79_9PEZI|nr:hypothetical protein ColLi_02790 [Colletotrichum liriopes]
MPEPATAPWGLSISDADFAKLKAGLEPMDQDDKWRYAATDDSESGTVTIHIVRVGMGHELYSVVVRPGDGRAKIEAISWSQDQGGIRISEGVAKKHVVVLSRCNLECDFEALPDFDSEDFFDEPAVDAVNNVSNGINGTR